VVAILVLMGLAIARRRARIEYVGWRMSHGALALVAMLLVMVHAYMVGGYTGTPVKQALWIGYGGICALLVAYLRIFKPWRMTRRPYRVVGVSAEHGAVYSLALEPEGHSGLTFLPGQFAWITTRRSPFSAGEHPFSFSSSSERPQRVEFAIKELGDFSRTIKDLPVGERVYIDGPYGSCSPDRHDGAEELLLIAGGIGIAPMMSILRTLADRHDSRPVQLIYGSWSLDWASFREELDALAATLNLRLVHTLEHPPEGWVGETGYVTGEMLRRYLPSGENRYRVFVCGPLAMLNAVTRALASLGVPRTLISLERFDLA
jgi:predicted ferric reductase